MKNERVHWIDIAKGIGIILVILGHTSFAQGNIYKWIFSFHMPLFFFLAGLVLRNNGWKKYVASRWKSLLVPYLLYSALYIVTDWTLNRMSVQEVWGRICTALLGMEEMLWFVVAIFTCELMVAFVLEKINTIVAQTMTIALISFLGLVLCYFDIYLPYRVQTAMAQTIFVYAGYSIKSWKMQPLASNSKIKILIVVMVAGGLNLVTMLLNLTVDVRLNQYGNVILFLIEASAGIVAICGIALTLEENRLLELAGRNTLVLYALNVYVPVTLHHFARANNLIVKAGSIFILGMAVLSNEWRIHMRKTKKGKNYKETVLDRNTSETR